MCARYTLRRAQLARAIFEALRAPSFEEFSERPHYNLAPSQRLPIVRINGKGERVLEAFQWGFVPRWAKAMPKVRPVNARAETLATSGLFRDALSRRRCLIPADGFYEWTGSRKSRQPFFLHMKDDGVFAFGGLWDRWYTLPAEHSGAPGANESDAGSLDTFTIITTAPNSVARTVHDRMPFIVHRHDYAQWLDAHSDRDSIAGLLQPFPSEDMEAFAVSTRVNSVTNDAPDLIERGQPTAPAPAQGILFT
ncbi:MAG TPA: SOS response-associated peptidase [Tepidisphaeraceae bacterium]|jgi:putative SOS response-associated peptidase YedK